MAESSRSAVRGATGPIGDGESFGGLHVYVFKSLFHGPEYARVFDSILERGGRGVRYDDPTANLVVVPPPNRARPLTSPVDLAIMDYISAASGSSDMVQLDADQLDRLSPFTLSRLKEIAPDRTTGENMPDQDDENPNPITQAYGETSSIAPVASSSESVPARSKRKDPPAATPPSAPPPSASDDANVGVKGVKKIKGVSKQPTPRFFKADGRVSLDKLKTVARWMVVDFDWTGKKRMDFIKHYCKEYNRLYVAGPVQSTQTASMSNFLSHWRIPFARICPEFRDATSVSEEDVRVSEDEYSLLVINDADLWEKAPLPPGFDGIDLLAHVAVQPDGWRDKPGTITTATSIPETDNSTVRNEPRLSRLSTGETHHAGENLDASLLTSLDSLDASVGSAEPIMASDLPQTFLPSTPSPVTHKELQTIDESGSSFDASLDFYDNGGVDPYTDTEDPGSPSSSACTIPSDSVETLSDNAYGDDDNAISAAEYEDSIVSTSDSGAAAWKTDPSLKPSLAYTNSSASPEFRGSKSQQLSTLAHASSRLDTRSSPSGITRIQDQPPHPDPYEHLVDTAKSLNEKTQRVYVMPLAHCGSGDFETWARLVNSIGLSYENCLNDIVRLQGVLMVIFRFDASPDGPSTNPGTPQYCVCGADVTRRVWSMWPPSGNAGPDMNLDPSNRAVAAYQFKTRLIAAIERQRLIEDKAGMSATIPPASVPDNWTYKQVDIESLGTREAESGVGRPSHPALFRAITRMCQGSTAWATSQ